MEKHGPRRRGPESGQEPNLCSFPLHLEKESNFSSINLMFQEFEEIFPQNSEIIEIYTYVHPARFPPHPMIMTETSSPSPFFESSFFLVGAAEWPKVSDCSDRCSSSQLVQITKLAQCPSDRSLARKSKGPKEEIARPY